MKTLNFVYGVAKHIHIGFNTESWQVGHFHMAIFYGGASTGYFNIGVFVKR